jgi:membrane-bound lytic murein transglycosylase MltF
MKARSRLCLVLAALCVALLVPRVVPAAVSSSGPRPLVPASKSLLDRGAYTGDLDVMLRKRSVRVLTAYSRTHFFLDKGQTKGLTYDYMREFETFLQKWLGRKQPKPVVYFVPTTRERLIPALLAGEGDVIAANLTVTPERKTKVEFSNPYLENVKEVVVTGPMSPVMVRLEDLAGSEVYMRRASSYWASLEQLTSRFVAEGRPPVRLWAADEHLEDEDLLEMLNAGLIPLVVVDDNKARLWAQVLPAIQSHDDLVVREGGDIAFAFRKGSPQLKSALDAFVKKTAKGTLFGNVVFSKYLTEGDFVKNAAADKERRKLESILAIFRRFGDHYGFDHLMLAAQGYQESQLDHSVRSPAGAVGVMQVLPSTAKDPNVDIADIDKIENNIHAAAKYMRFVTDTFLAAPQTDEFNRTMFAFASYNAGPAKVAKLRRLAAKRGLDPDQWFGNVELVAADVIGRETVQ